ncbi:MAG TPA: hypothetical protein VKQ36_16340 [Ktedonobacterales bacterium]|nr:hypothetical protein [Ktedonobacterales bacterium]
MRLPGFSSSSASRPSPRPTPVSVRWAVTIYRALLALCPRDLRQGYGDDMAQVFRQVCRDAHASQGAWGILWLAPATLGDLLTGAAAEYLTVFLTLWKEFWMTNRLRASAITVFCAYIAFIVSGIGYQKMTETPIQTGIQDAHPALSISFLLVEIGAVVALLAVLVGGLPLAFAALRYSLAARRRDIPLLFGVPVVAFAALVGYVNLISLLHLAGSHPANTGPTPHDRIYASGLIALFVLGAIASAWAVSQAIARAQLGDSLIRFTRIPAIIATLAMALMFVSVVVWGLGLLANDPQMFNGGDGVLATNTAISWGVLIVVMGIATLVAIIGLVRGRGTAPSQEEVAAAAA